MVEEEMKMERDGKGRDGINGMGWDEDEWKREMKKMRWR